MGWILVAAVLAPACDFYGDCPSVRQEVVPMPSGSFGSATGILERTTTGDPINTLTFPRAEFVETAGGVAGPGGGGSGGLPTSDLYYQPLPIPSARLTVDVAEGVVVRSYVDGDGRTVTETWIRKEGGR